MTKSLKAYKQTVHVASQVVACSSLQDSTENAEIVSPDLVFATSLPRAQTTTSRRLGPYDCMRGELA